MSTQQSSEILFVGGPLNGERINVPSDIRHYKVRDGSIYVRSLYSADEEMLTLFVHKSLRPGEALKLLIERYPKGNG